MKNVFLSFLIMASLTTAAIAQPAEYESDRIQTSGGELTMYFIGHGSLMFDFAGKKIYVDPWSKLADYSGFPKADLILITHQHRDHLDPKAISDVTKEDTKLVETQTVYDELNKGRVMKNGDQITIEGVEIEAVPAYNTTEGRDKFHPKGRDNGYILTFSDKRVYVAGDTEDIPEMDTLKDIDIAFLPMNQPYTMTPEQVAHAAEMIHPKILYPYHYGDTDVSELLRLMADDKAVDVRVRKLE